MGFDWLDLSFDQHEDCKPPGNWSVFPCDNRRIRICQQIAPGSFSSQGFTCELDVSDFCLNRRESLHSRPG